MPKMKYVTSKDVNNLLQKNSEIGFAHTSHMVDMLQYEYLKEGNPKAVEASVRVFRADIQGHLSDDPLRNLKYLFIINTGLASRYAVEGGLDLEKAYAISDLYINKVDSINKPDEVYVLQKEMIAHYTTQVALSKKEHIFSKPIIKSMEYIHTHITEPIKLKDVATYVGLNTNYLTTLFKKETMKTPYTYILEKKVEIAKSMLKHSDKSYSHIASSLAFSSQSHFTKVFKEQTGYTPRSYRMLFYKQSIILNNTFK